VSLVFVATANGPPKAQDDARNIKAVDPFAYDGLLAFDHARILADYRRYRETGRSPAWFPRGA
jgi:8-oxo-dGTP diphosphatase